MATSEDDEAYWNETKSKAFNFEEDEGIGSQLFGISQAGTHRLSRQVRSGIADDTAQASLFFSDSSVSSVSAVSGGSTSVLFPPTTSVGASKTSDDSLQLSVSDSTMQRILNAEKALEIKPKGKITPEEELMVLRRKVQNRWEAPPIEEALRRILLGLPFSLDAYRSLEDKTKILDAALDQGNGDAILSVVIFLSKTLKQSLFTHLLSTRPVAVNHYAAHLATRFQLTELNNLLESLGRSREASIIQFSLAMRGVQNARTNPIRSQRVLNTLRNCLASHFSNGSAEMDRPFIVNAIKLFEWQMAADESFKSQNTGLSPEEATLGLAALATLAHSCRYHWEGNKPKSGVVDPLSPSALCQSLGISQRAYQWTALRVKAQEHNWEAVDGLFLTKGWFQGIRLIGGTSGTPMADVAAELHAQGAPEEVVVRYINLVEGIEERIALANRLQCYNAAIDIMKSQGDRLGIIKLKSRLPTGSKGELYAELALRSSSIKWKN